MKSMFNVLITTLNIGANLYKALVFMFLYNWFIASTLNVNEINYLISIALVLTVNILLGRSADAILIHYIYKDMTDEEKIGYSLGSLVGRFIGLTIAWLVGLVIYLVV